MKKTLYTLIFLLMVTASGLLGLFYYDTLNPYPEVILDKGKAPTFSQVEFPFEHQHNKNNSLPFVGSAIIDVNGDGVEEVFIGGGYNQQDGLFAYKGNAFVDITENSGLNKKLEDTTFGAAVTDVDADGDADMFVTRDSGVYLYVNDNGTFISSKLDIPFNMKSTPLSIALTDLNHDGHVDMFVSCYIKFPFVEGQTIFNKLGYGATSMMLLNNGDNTFRDITTEAGLNYIHNTFQAVFVDLDNDNHADLVVAYDTGQVRTYKNMGNRTFYLKENPNTQEYSYPMGIGVGDYNNDGLIDLFFSNIGSTPPRFLVRGDLTDDQVLNGDWMFFKNEGGFKFSDVAAETKVKDFEFAWGAVITDFNLDGRQDLLVAENYIKYIPHRIIALPGRLLIQKDNLTFASAEQEGGIVNKNYAISPLIADFNHDGYPDIIQVNLNGPIRAFINNGGNANYLKVQLENNAKSMGARVTVTTKDGKKLTEHYLQSEGLASSQSPVMFIGLGESTNIEKVKIEYLDGDIVFKENVKINQILRIDH